MSELVLANLAVLLAALVQTATGVGFAMLAVPLLALISLDWVPAPMLVCNIVLSLVVLFRGRRSIVPAEAGPLAAGLLTGSAVGAAVLAALPAQYLGMAIGAIVVTAVALSLAAPPVRVTGRRIIGVATLGGATGVIAGMHGPPLILLYQHEPPAKVRPTMAGVFIFGSLLALGALWLAGRLGPDDIGRGFALLPGLGVGYLAGLGLAARLPDALVRLGMLAVAGAAGAALLVRGA